MIRIQNIYYMLAYAFRILHEQGYRDVAAEEFENVAELLTEILCRGVSVQIKRGLCRQYISSAIFYMSEWQQAIFQSEEYSFSEARSYRDKQKCVIGLIP